MKKVLSILLAAIMLFSMAACGSTETAAPEADAQVEAEAQDAQAEDAEAASGDYQTALDLYKNGVDGYAYPAGEFKKYDEPINMSVNNSIDLQSEALLKMAEAGEPYENGRWIQYFRDDCNIEWTYDWCTSNTADYKQKLTVSMASGELADVIYVPDQESIKQLADAGLIWDLTEIYQDNVNETLAKLVEEEGTDFYGSGIYDGKLYAFPVKMPSTNCVNHCWVRRDWLEACGLELPKTMDDVKNIAQAFKDNCGGEGLLFSKDFVYEYQGAFWGFGGQQNYKRTQWVEQEDGTLAFAEVLDSMKGGLKWFNELYEAGLIPKESISLGGYDAIAEYVATNTVGIMYGPHWYGFQLQNFESSMDPEADWIEVGCMPSESGNDVEAIPAINTNDGWYVVNKNCEHPDAMIQTLNAYAEKLFGENNDFANFFACEGNSSEWGIAPIHVLSATVDLLPYWEMRKCTNPETREVDAESMVIPGTTYWEYIQNGLSAYQYMFGPLDSCFVYTDSVYPDKFDWNKYVFAPTETYNERWSSLLEILDSYEIKMVTGEIEVDGGFEEMVQKWNEAGGAQITEEFNAVYNEFK